MIDRWGYERKGYRSNKRSTYRPMSRYRQKSKFNVSKLRSRRRTAGLKKSLTTIFRKQLLLKPDPLTGHILFCTYASEDNFKSTANYEKIFDEYKILKVYHKFRVEKSANVENDQDDIDITHWSCYDPDAGSRTFAGIEDFQKCVNSKWHKIV